MMVLPVGMLPLSDVTCERQSGSYPHHRISQDSYNPFTHYNWSLYSVCVLLQPSYPRFSNSLQCLHKYSQSLNVTSDHAHLGIIVGSQTCQGWLTWKVGGYYLGARDDWWHTPSSFLAASGSFAMCLLLFSATSHPTALHSLSLGCHPPNQLHFCNKLLTSLTAPWTSILQFTTIG